MRVLYIGVLTFLLFLSGCARDNPQPKTVLVVSAAASLKDVATLLASQFQQQHSGIEVRHNFGGSGALQRQIEQGAPVDVYIAAAARNMDELAAKKLIETDTLRTLARNQLVLIVPQTSRFKITQVLDLTDAKITRIAIATPSSAPAGEYTRQTLTFLKLRDKLQPKLVQMRDVREVLTQVELGNVEAGFVYATDARKSSRARAVAIAPSESHQPIIYPVAVIKSTQHPSEAGVYIEYLKSQSAREILRAHGFMLPVAD